MQLQMKQSAKTTLVQDDAQRKCIMSTTRTVLLRMALPLVAESACNNLN